MNVRHEVWPLPADLTGHLCSRRLCVSLLPPDRQLLALSPAPCRRSVSYAEASGAGRSDGPRLQFFVAGRPVPLTDSIFKVT